MIINLVLLLYVRNFRVKNGNEIIILYAITFSFYNFYNNF